VRGLVARNRISSCSTGVWPVRTPLLAGRGLDGRPGPRFLLQPRQRKQPIWFGERAGGCSGMRSTGAVARNGLPSTRFPQAARAGRDPLERRPSLQPGAVVQAGIAAEFPSRSGKPPLHSLGSSVADCASFCGRPLGGAANYVSTCATPGMPGWDPAPGSSQVFVAGDIMAGVKIRALIYADVAWWSRLRVNKAGSCPRVTAG